MKKLLNILISTGTIFVLSAIIALAASTFPTTLNDWEDNEIIESGWADALESKIGVDNSAVTTSLDYKLKNSASVDPGHLHTSAGISGTISVAKGGSGASTLTGILLGNGTSAFTGLTTSAGISGAISDEQGSGALVFATSPALTTPNLGTPSAVTLTNGTGLPISTGVSGLGTGVATFLGTPSSANLIAATTDETGTGSLVFANTPTLVTPVIGAATGTSVALTTSATIGAAGTATGTLLLKGTTSGTVTVTTAAAAGTYTLTLPTDDGTASQLLTTDGSGVLSWTTVTPGTGDVTAVGDCTTAACFDGTSGTTLTFNNAGGDATLDYDGTDFSFSKTIETTGDVTVTGSDITLGVAGVKMTGDGDGAITWLGLGDGSDEDLTLNLDDTSNVGTFTSSTLLATLNFSSIALQESGIGVLNNDEIDASSELLAIMDDETGSGLLVFATSPTLTTPRIADLGFIADTSGNELLVFDTATTPVNQLMVSNAATLNIPFLSATGDDTNVDLGFLPKGAGNFYLLTTSSGPALLAFREDADNGSNAIGLTVASSLTTNPILTLPEATDTLVGKATTDILTNKTLTAPKFADLGFIADANGNELIILDTTASAVNEWTLANGSTGVNPLLTASGETNVGLDFLMKGTGTFRLTGNATQAAELRLYEDTTDGTNYTAFKVGTQAGDVTYTLPTDDGDADQVLSTNGSGTLDWVTGGSATKQFFVPVTNHDGTLSTAVLGGFTLFILSAAQECWLNFHIPDDFTSLTEAKILMYPDTTETIQFDTVLNFGTHGEASSSDTIVDGTQAVTADVFQEVDVSAGFTGIAAGDFIGFNFESDTGDLRIIGLMIKYD